jgi:hypothetical protein
MDPTTAQTTSSILEAVFGLVIGVPILLFGRRLFWLMGGLATAVIGISVASVIVFVIIVARYPAVAQALPELVQAAQTGEATKSSTAPFSEDRAEALAAEANTALGEAATQFGVLIVLAGLISGVVGALALIRFPRAASTLVGFVGGMFLLLQLFELYSVNLPGPLNALLALIAGVAVAVFARRNPDTSLIVLSTFIGTIIVVEGVKLFPYSSLSAILTLALMLTGVIYQTNAMHRRRAKAAKAATATQALAKS